ncbi:MAG TPA: glycosyl hydrolase family 17 protein, partial [Anaerolineales bacterium]|nr:glycosyl hydrolase family 17 protein [Anaerolineales bacterium]
TSDGVISLVPDQFTFTGDVTTFENAQGQCTEPWFTDTPPGTIILGVNPANCEPESWSGGTATADIFLPNPNPKTVYVLKLAWPDHDGKGLHSPDENQTAVITLNGKPVWSKRTTEVSTYGDYYGAQHEAIQTTLVVTQSLTHTLSIHVPAHTAWDLSFITLTPYPMPDTIRGIGYSPYRDCQAPGGEIEPTVQNVRDDLVRLFHTSNFIRTYAATGINHEIPALANAQGLPIFAGAWLDDDGSDPSPDDEEIQALIDLANTNDLEGAIVGNEYILRHNTPAFMNVLLQRIQQVRSGIDDPTLPLMTAEIDGIMFNWDAQNPTVITGIVPAYRPILDEVDYVLVHIYPFWMYRSVDGAAAFTVARYKAIQVLIAQEYPGQNKRIIIGETGWPSAGPSLGAAVPSLANQTQYLKEFMALAERENVEYMYFDAMDELWKTEGGVGSHWGYSYFDRSAKHAFYGVLFPGNELFPFLYYLPFAAHSSSNDLDTFSFNLSMDSSPVTFMTTSFPVYLDWPGSPDGFVPSYLGDYENISTPAAKPAVPADVTTPAAKPYSPADVFAPAAKP